MLNSYLRDSIALVEESKRQCRQSKRRVAKVRTSLRRLKQSAERKTL